MPVPTHGPDCYSKAIKLTCYYCDQEVYFFFCNHGTKVFFDSLGLPWPIHQCRERIIIEVLIERFGVIDSAVRRHLSVISKELGIEIDNHTSTVIERQIARSERQQRILSIAPNSSSDSVLGKVTNINKDINFYRKFGFEKTDLSKKLLGILTHEAYDEITIREKPDENNTLREFLIYLPSKLVVLLKIRINTPIIAKISMHTTIKGNNIWLVENINKIDDN